MIRFLLAISVFFILFTLQGITLVNAQDECSDPPMECTSDADCRDILRPKCNLELGICESEPLSCQTDADCSNPCQPICDMSTSICVDQIVEEEGCDDLVGAAFGLCNAYCEAMDCDGEPQASERACDKVLSNYEKITGESMPLCSED